MSDLVSIIMPNYNGSKYLAESLRSVISQTYENWELIIIDDCSTDNSIEIIKKFQLSNNKIRLFVNDKNMGAAFSRNVALQKARGRWIAFLDSDDLWINSKLEMQIEFMINNGYLFTYTKYEEIDEDSNRRHILVSGPKKITNRKLYQFNYIGCLTAIYDKEQIGVVYVNEKLKSKNDYAMWLKISKKANCYLFSRMTAFYRRRSGSISHKGLKNSIKNQYLLFKLGDEKSSFAAFYYTMKNMFYAVLKKLFYVKHIKTGKQ